MQPDIPPADQLAHNVQRLALGTTTTSMRRVYGKKGRTLVTIHHDPLIAMLRSQMIGTSGAGGTTSTAANARSVVDDDALTKMKELRADIWALWSALLPGATKLGILRRPPVLLEVALDGWHDMFTTHRRAGLAPASELYRALRVTTKWVETIEQKFDPIYTVPFRGACPVCRARWSIDGDGIMASRVDAIAFTVPGAIADASAICRECGTVWRGHEQLARLAVGEPPKPTPQYVVAEGGSDTA